MNILTSALPSFSIVLIPALVLVFFLLYAWYYSRVRALQIDSGNIAELSVRIDHLNQEYKFLLEQKNAVEAELRNRVIEEQELARLRQELANVQNEYLNSEEALKNQKAESIQIQDLTAKLNNERDELSGTVNKLREEKEQAASEVERLRKEKEGNLEEKNIIQFELKKLSDQVITATEQIVVLDKENSDKKNYKDGLEASIQGSEKLKIDLDGQITKIKETITELQTNLGQLEARTIEKRALDDEIHLGKRELASIKEDIHQKQIERDAIEKRVAKNLAALGEEGSEAHPYRDLYRAPQIFTNEGEKSSTDMEEQKALETVREYLISEKLFFSDRILKAFHTSLKISDIVSLTVLAGISGTGKTLLPIKYAQALGLSSQIVSVQPKWDSPQDLFGFYNYIEQSFKATELTQALLCMDPYNTFKELPDRTDRVLIVVLDEMNLARVEYYFSEFLSKLELRRLVTDSSDSNQRLKAEIELEVGPHKNDKQRFRIWVPENVLFVGTMNEDESTQTLSDKVLDRANVLRFGVPPAEAMNKSAQSKSDSHSNGNNVRISQSQWNKWRRKLDNTKDISNASEILSITNKWITRINEALDLVGRPVGFRVRDAMQAYVLNYPGISDGKSHKVAFADQIEQKILPKLRGLEVGSTAFQDAVPAFEQVLSEVDDDALTEAFDKAKSENNVDNAGLFMFKGVTRK